MSQRLGCELEDKISAIAVVAATMGRELFARCKPARPVSVLIIDGTEDPLVPYEGGRVQVRAGIVSAPDAADFSRRYPLGTIGPLARADSVLPRRAEVHQPRYIATRGFDSKRRFNLRNGCSSRLQDRAATP